MRSRAIICGGRGFKDYTLLKGALSRLAPTVVINGGARGADALAQLYAHEHNLLCITVPADWDAWGRAAGPIRNKQMLDHCEPDMVIAFPGGAGTRNMMEQARKRDLPVHEIRRY